MKKVLLGLAFVAGIYTPVVAGMWRVTSVKGSLADTLVALQSGSETKLTDLIVSGEAAEEDLFALSALPDLRFIDLSGLLVEESVIPDSLFYGKKLQRIIFPDGIEAIGESAFEKSGLEGLIRLPKSLERIEKRVFKDCFSVTSFSSFGSSNSLRYIGIEAFSGCNSWEGSLAMPVAVDSIGQGAFALCERLEGTLTLPDSLLEVGFGVAERGVFEGCGFVRLILGKYIEHLGKAAFRHCSRLGGTTRFNDHIVFGDSVFYGVGDDFDTIPSPSVYVALAGSDDNDGLSWETPFRSLARAITAVCEEDRNFHIYLGEGTYIEESLPVITQPIYLHGGYSNNNQNTNPSIIVLNHSDESGLVFKSSDGTLLSLRLDNFTLIGLHVSSPLSLIGVNKGYSLSDAVVQNHLSLEGDRVKLCDTITISGEVIADGADLVLEDLVLRRTSDATFRVGIPKNFGLYYEWSVLNPDFPLLVSAEEWPLDLVYPLIVSSQETNYVSPVLMWKEQEDGYLLYCTGQSSEIPGFSIIAPYSLVLGDRASYTLYPIADIPLSEDIFPLIEWSVGDSTLLSINANTITGRGKAGETFIKARLGENIATRDVYIGQLSIDRPEATVIPPNTVTNFTATLFPLSMVHRDIAWSIDNPNIATVDGDGVVTTGDITGTFTLTAYMVNGPDVRDVRTYYVGTCISDIVIPMVSRIVVGDTVKVTAIVTPSNALMQVLDWSVGDSSRLHIIETDELSCTIVGKKTGTVELYAEAADGGKASAMRAVTISASPPTPIVAAVVPLCRSVEYNKGTLSCLQLADFRVSLHAITGQPIATFQPTQAAENFHIPLYTGIYILSAEKGDERFMTKFVVE
ncbi:MAG: leucine-rich repeat protein [Tannerellaceae bacterium]|jgi:hypothetical protein|nr:leucine-rich repeat protein [Tannerellaceae bacterium]